MLQTTQYACIYTWIRGSSIPPTRTAPNTSQDMLHISVFCLVSWLKALAILQKWAGALEELWEKATPELIFFKECLKSKTEPELIHGKKAKQTFMEYLYLLGIVLGPRLAKSFGKGPYSTYLGFGRPESHVTTPGFCYCSASSHRQLPNALVWRCSSKALCAETGGMLDLACWLQFVYPWPKGFTRDLTEGTKKGTLVIFPT